MTRVFCLGSYVKPLHVFDNAILEGKLLRVCKLIWAATPWRELARLRSKWEEKDTAVGAGR